MTILENKIFDEINVGDSASLSHVLTRRDIELFAAASGDVNPAHLDEEYAKDSFFGKIIGHGIWSGSLISAVLGTVLPGPGTIYLSQSLKFLKPVFVGDEVIAKVVVLEKRDKRDVVVFDCVCVNQRGEKVVEGVAEVMAPTEKVRREAVPVHP